MRPRLNDLVGAEQRRTGEAADILRQAEHDAEADNEAFALFQHLAKTEQQGRTDEEG